MAKVTQAHIRATSKYEAKAYDKILVRFPKGTRDRIKSTGESINGYVVRCVLASLGDTETPGDAQSSTRDGDAE